MDADPNSGANVYVGGTPEAIGGTSLRRRWRLASGRASRSPTPTSSGSPRRGSTRPAGGPGFHDVILGDNGAYPATPGWDYATGPGTINVATAIATIPLNPGAQPDRGGRGRVALVTTT